MMKKLCVEGWRGINHSYAIVNQWQLLEFAKLPITLCHRNVPYYGISWNREDNANGFTHEQNQVIFSIDEPTSEELFDVTYRISFPYDLKECSSEKIFVFGTTETQKSLQEKLINGTPADVNRGDQLSIITPSEWSKIGFLQTGFNDEKIHVISHGIDPDTFHSVDQATKKQFRDALSIQEADFVLLSIGTMAGNKGIDLLLIAFSLLKREYPNLKLILKDQSNLYGIKAQSILETLKSSPCAELLTSDVISSIIFISHNLTLAQLHSLYNASDCYVSPYRAEGFNLPPLEAAACGVPIVVTKGGATDDYFKPLLGSQIESTIVEFDGGFILEPDIDSLIMAVSEVIESKDTFGGTKGSEYIHSYFSWAEVTEKLVQLFN